jgi:hypothetical protein
MAESPLWDHSTVAPSESFEPISAKTVRRRNRKTGIVFGVIEANVLAAVVYIRDQGKLADDDEIVALTGFTLGQVVHAREALFNRGMLEKA